jgi:hypothetical protein
MIQKITNSINRFYSETSNDIFFNDKIISINTKGSWSYLIVPIIFYVISLSVSNFYRSEFLCFVLSFLYSHVIYVIFINFIHTNYIIIDTEDRAVYIQSLIKKSQYRCFFINGSTFMVKKYFFFKFLYYRIEAKKDNRNYILANCFRSKKEAQKALKFIESKLSISPTS